jgi:hypothetical protein
MPHSPRPRRDAGAGARCRDRRHPPAVRPDDILDQVRVRAEPFARTVQGSCRETVRGGGRRATDGGRTVTNVCKVAATRGAFSTGVRPSRSLQSAARQAPLSNDGGARQKG